MCVVACTVCQHIRILDALVPTPTISHWTKADRVLGAPIRPTGRVRVFWHFSCHLTSPHSSYPRGYHGPFGARAAPVRYRGLRSGFEPSGLDRPGRLPHQQGLCEAARLGLQDGSPQLPKSCWFLLLSKIQNLFSSFRVSVPAVRWGASNAFIMLDPAVSGAHEYETQADAQASLVAAPCCPWHAPRVSRLAGRSCLSTTRMTRMTRPSLPVACAPCAAAPFLLGRVKLQRAKKLLPQRAWKQQTRRCQMGRRSRLSTAFRKCSLSTARATKLSLNRWKLN